MNKVEKAILRTLAFFDIFGKPLTLEEIWHFLYQVKASRLQVLLGLKKLQKKQLILQKNDYFFLISRQKSVTSFLAKQSVCQSYWQKVNWISELLKYVPFVRNISVINSLSIGTAKETSDIDILLISKKNRLWTARTLVVLLLEIIGQNKNKWYRAGKICLGFAFDENHLPLASLRYKKDIAFTYFLANLTPVYDNKVYSKLIEQNSWLLDDLPNWQSKNPSKNRFGKSFLEKIFQGKFGDWVENFLANWQIKRIWADPENWRQGASVVADRQMMKLHAYDKRKAQIEQWHNLTKNLLLS